MAKYNPESPYSRHGQAICEKQKPVSRAKAPWPEHTSYGGDNEHPDAPPYNFTHRPGYATPLIRRQEDNFSW